MRILYAGWAETHHVRNNCWGYYTMGLITLRCTRWMDAYGWGEDFDFILRRWLEAWTEHFDEVPLGQELDPVTGIPTAASPWYSSGMLSYIYAAKRLGFTD